MEKSRCFSEVSSEGDNIMGCKTAERVGPQKVLCASGKCMLDNDTYNLMEQLEIESRSLWRIENDYKNDASTDNETRQLWNLIEKDKEKIVRILTEKVRERL